MDEQKVGKKVWKYLDIFGPEIKNPVDAKAEARKIVGNVVMSSTFVAPGHYKIGYLEAEKVVVIKTFQGLVGAVEGLPEGYSYRIVEEGS